MKKEVLKLLENQEEYIVISKIGMANRGKVPTLLTFLCMLVDNLKTDIPEKLIKETIDLGLNDEKERIKKLKDILDELLENIK